ncbi:MAG: MCE family protein [Thermodesulfobacteria bacterium]|nr:MCE family protein [Thermodesulfobacteriota bacterium]
MRGSTEIKVGIFVFIGIVALLYLSFRLGEEAFTSQKTYPLYAIFKNVSGLSPGAKIEMAGVLIGKVGNISLTPDGRAKVVLNIFEKYKIPAKTQAFIKTYGVLGDKYIELKPYPSKRYLKPGEYIAITHGTVSLEDILAQIQPTIKGLNEIFGTEQGKNTLKNFITNLEKASESVRYITEYVRKGKGTLGKILMSEELYDELKSTVQTMEKISKDIDESQKVLSRFIRKEKFFEHLNNIAKNLEDITSALKAGNGTLGKLIKSDQLYNELQDVVLNLKEVSEELKSGNGTLAKLIRDKTLYNKLITVANNLEEVSKELKQGKGTLGKLLKDDSLYVEAKKTLRSINRAAQNVEDQVFITVLGTVAGAAMR